MKRKAILYTIFLCVIYQIGVAQSTNIVDSLGRKQGLWINIKDSTTNTRIFSNYLNNELHGEFKILVGESEIYRCLYKMGLKDGYEILHHINGIIQESNTYESDTIINSLYFYDTGSVKEEVYYLHGLKNGTNKLYYPNGKIRQIRSYSNGIAEGYHISFKRNGKISVIFLFEKGIITKTW